MADSITVVNSTISDYLRKGADNTLRRREVLAMMQAKGRISFNHGGLNLNWPIEFNRGRPTVYTEGAERTFTPIDRYRRAVLDWKGYDVTDVMTGFEKAKNTGPAMLYNRYAELIPQMTEDATQGLAQEFYGDGNASGRVGCYHGIESFMGVTGAASGVANVPSDSYAGLSTGLGALGGTFTGTWPVGTGDVVYDYFSPIVVNYASAGFSATATWAANCVDAIRFLITNTQLHQSKMDRMELIMLNSDLHRQLKTVYGAKEQLPVDRNQKVGLSALGFPDVLSLDGVEIASEYGVPAGVGYGLTVKQMELMSMKGKVVFANDPPVFYDINTDSHKVVVSTWGNFRFNPRYFGKLMSGLS